MARAAARAATPPAPARRARRRSIEEDVLLTAVLCLVAFGAVMVYSASSASTVIRGGGDGTSFLVRYVLYGAAGFAAMWAIARMPLQRFLELTSPLLGIAFGLLVLVRMPGFGVSVNGARRWLGAGPLTFQPSEIAKLALVLYAARFLAERPRGFRRWQELVPLGLVTGMAALLVASQPDLGTALVIAFTAAAMLIAAGVPLRWLGGAAGVGATFVLLYAMSAPYRRARLTSFLDPWHHAGSTGFQAVQGQIALGSGGMLGRGLGESVQKIFYLPEAHTDFILAVIGEELGLVGVLGLLAVYGVIAWAGLRIAQRAKGRYAALLAAGLTSLVLCQAMLNVFVVLGIAPLTGVPLPFISYGSTNLVVLLAGVGLLLNVARGGSVHLRAVGGARDQARSRADGHEDLRHRGRGNGGARHPGAGGRRRAAG
ncbi:MAG TPA: putative lipid II flippase FtsW [Solirubrobacteraceae bacterium]|nr:putative lipid II flippase FtsW [Solirubrobacteraceae bacterium]